MPTIGQVWQCIKYDSYTYSIDLEDAFYTFPLLRMTITFYISLATQTLSMEEFAIWAGCGYKAFTSLTKPILFLCQHKVVHVIIYFDDILALTHSKHAGKRAWTLCSL